MRKLSGIRNGFTLVELIVSIAILLILAVFIVVLSGEMLLMTAKSQSRDISTSLAQAKVEELRSTLVIPDFEQDSPKPGYIRTVTSTFVTQTGTTAIVRYLRHVTVVVQGPANLGTKTVSLETYIQTYRPQVAFVFPQENTAYVTRDGNKETHLLGTIRDDGHEINKADVQVRTSANGGGTWTNWQSLSDIFLDKDCTQPAPSTLSIGVIYYFRYIIRDSAADESTLDLQVQVTNTGGDYNFQPVSPRSSSSWARLTTDNSRPTISLTTSPSNFVTQSFEATVTCSDGLSDIFRPFVVIEKVDPAGVHYYWDEGNREWSPATGGIYYNSAEPNLDAGSWIYPPCLEDLEDTIRQAFNLSVINAPRGTVYYVKALALDNVIGKFYSYLNQIPAQKQVLPWLDINANYDLSATATLLKVAAPTVMTLPATDITHKAAILNAQINPNDLPTTAWFEWGPDQSYGNNTTPQNIGSGTSTVPFSSLITGLSPSGTYHFRAAAANVGGTAYGEDWFFTTSPLPPLELQSPNGGENWIIGSSQTIAWTSSGISGNVRIELSRDGGSSYPEVIAASLPISPGSYNWTVTGPASSSCRVKVTSIESGVYDVSDGNFTVAVPPNITVQSPNGGENWIIGSSQTIAWTSSGISGNVRIELSRDGGSSYPEVIAASLPISPGSYNWTVTGPASSSCRVKVTSIESGVYDVSDGNFTVPTPQISVTRPNGGNSWKIGTSQSIRWSFTNLVGNVKIEINRNYAGGQWEVLAESVPIGTGGVGSWNWVVTGPTSTKCRVRITSLAYPSLSDISDKNFTVKN